MKTIKELAKKKVALKIRTVGAVKKNVKKTRTEPAAKRTKKRIVAIAASKKPANQSSKRKRIIAYRLKRLTYMVLSLTLGALSSSLLLGFLEKIYLENDFKIGKIPYTHQFLGMQLFLPSSVYVVIFMTGITFGTWLGFWGWRIVYIEHNHRMFRKS